MKIIKILKFFKCFNRKNIERVLLFKSAGATYRDSIKEFLHNESYI